MYNVLLKFKSKTLKKFSRKWITKSSIKRKNIVDVESISDIFSDELFISVRPELIRLFDSMKKEFILSLNEKAKSIELAVIENERNSNEIFLETIKENLRKVHLGKYVVIANAEIQAIGKTYDSVKDKGLNSNHRFIFRVEENDPEQEILSW